LGSFQIFNALYKNQAKISLLALPLIAIMMAAGVILVYSMDGLQYSFSHFMYVPIIFSGLLFGIKGGTLCGIIAGIVLGPVMPIDVGLKIEQTSLNWIWRMIFFTLVGGFSGTASHIAGAYISHLRWLSTHDTDSRLPNRQALVTEIENLCEQQNKTEEKKELAIFVLNFNNADELESAFGFAIIEFAIKEYAKRFSLAIPKNFSVYRIQEKELAAVLEKEDEQSLELLIESLKTRFLNPFYFNGISVYVNIKMGYFIFNNADELGDEAIQKAEEALFLSNKSTEKCTAYNTSIGKSIKKNLQILGELKEALSTGQLSMYYQPKVELSTGIVKSAEALIRWNHPKLGNIPPASFIPTAEQSTLIRSVTNFALDQVMDQASSWESLGIKIPTAVNISTHNLLQPKFADEIKDKLDSHNLSTDNLELEITESSPMLEISKTIEEMKRISSNKIAISLDDFGTGFSSLQYLQTLPISCIKIDQSFVKKLPESKAAFHIVATTIELAHKLGLSTVAEGVETKEAYDCLVSLRCDFAQGFLISHPLSAHDFTEWYKQQAMKYVRG